MDQQLKLLFENWADEKLIRMTPLAISGSSRRYFRMNSESKTAIAVINSDLEENIAFLSFSEHFKAKGLPVPSIFAQDLDNNIYLQEDLGDTTLFSLIHTEKNNGGFSGRLSSVYKRVIEYLPQFQINASEGLNYELCYPRAAFDKRSMMWDLNYFKYYFLKLAEIPFNEEALENDFEQFAEYLLEADSNYFLYRDFQSRNIMVQEDELYFIDYQGGRKGPLQYDLASLLYDAKADLPQDVREELLSYYIENLKKYIPFDEKGFRDHFKAFVLIRIMQAMGAYGYRGFFEGKKHFLSSIPFALDNLKNILDGLDMKIKLPALLKILNELTMSDKLRNIGVNNLTVSINSFSYKRGIPIDESGNGGGHVFDCRALPNPGRFEAYVQLTGKDQSVIDFLKKEGEVSLFFEGCKNLTEQSVKKYIERDFQNLQINFGCTGGQHRSVYLAEKMARHLEGKFEVAIVLRHREQEMKQKH